MGSLKTLGSLDPENVISSQEMRRLEAASITSGAVTGYALMKRAGQGVVAAIQEAMFLRPGLKQNAVVLCGPGNNGGDGFVIARDLRDAGWDVTVCALAGTGLATGDAALAEQDWLVRGPVHPWSIAKQKLQEADVVVDALFGIGLSRPLEADVCDVIKAIPGSSFCVAVDVPSGFATDGEGRLGAVAVDADLVVTFHRPKPIHLELASLSVPVVVADIGL